jgi:hypothetical protein
VRGGSDLSLVSATSLLVRNLTTDERRFLEEVLLPATLQGESARKAVNRWARWSQRARIGVSPNRGLPQAICAALVALEFDGARESPAYRLLDQAHRLVYSMDAAAWRRGRAFHARLVTAE